MAAIKIAKRKSLLSEEEMKGSYFGILRTNEFRCSTYHAVSVRAFCPRSPLSPLDDFRCQHFLDVPRMRYASRSGSWTDRCPRTVSGYPSRASRERRKEPKRPGARGVDVRKGKLLAGDSGRKIAEVIDLRGAIYQRGSREGW